MFNFIEDYLYDPALAIANAQKSPRSWHNEVDEESIYSQLASPEFRLYEEMISA